MRLTDEKIKKWLVAFVLVSSFVAGWLFAAESVDAAVIASYTTDNSTAANGTAGNPSSSYIVFGQLSQEPNSLLLYASSTNPINAATTTALISCLNPTYDGGCYVVKYAYGYTISASKELLNISFANGTTTWNSNRYYYVFLQNGSRTQIFGNSSDTSTPGRFCTNFIGAGDSCTFSDSAVKRAWFMLITNPSYSTEGITRITTPTYGQVISSANNVNFSFDYYLNSLAYDKAGFALVDNTAGQTINTSSLEDTISSSGSSTFDDFLDLITGHNYTWTPYLRNSSSGDYLYGTSTFFFTGSNSSSIPPAPSPIWNGCNNILQPGCVISTSTGILTWNGGTTTTPLFGDTTLDQLLSRKAPFSYLYDVKQLIYELANGTSSTSYTQSCSTNDAYYTLPFGKTLSSGSSSVRIIDACTITNLSIVSSIRELIRNSLYLITGIGIAGMALSLL